MLPRRALAAALLLAATGLLPAAPAGATPAPLVTTDGIGVRVDITALDGDVLDALEAILQADVDAIVADAASGTNGPFPGATRVDVSSTVTLGLDVVAPGGGHPTGALALDLTVADLAVVYRMDPPWPFADCTISVTVAPGGVAVAADVDTGELPDPPFVAGAPDGSWDDEPTVGTTGVCWTYLIDGVVEEWWTAAWDEGDPDSAAGRIQAAAATAVDDLAGDAWDSLVVAPLDGLGAFGISLQVVTTDDDGVLVTATTDATAGLTIPGVGGPYSVVGAVDSGSTTTLLKVLDHRDQVIVSIHPNVRNQAEEAFAQAGVPFDPGFVSATPVDLRGVPVTLCTTCGPYAGDDRLTEVYEVG